MWQFMQHLFYSEWVKSYGSPICGPGCGFHETTTIACIKSDNIPVYCYGSGTIMISTRRYPSCISIEPEVAATVLILLRRLNQHATADGPAKFGFLSVTTRLVRQLTPRHPLIGQIQDRDRLLSTPAASLSSYVFAHASRGTARHLRTSCLRL